MKKKHGRGLKFSQNFQSSVVVGKKINRDIFWVIIFLRVIVFMAVCTSSSGFSVPYNFSISLTRVSCRACPTFGTLRVILDYTSILMYFVFLTDDKIK